MPPLTAENLRMELRHFSETTLRGQLEELSTAIQEGLRFEMQHIISSRLESNKSLPPEQSLSQTLVQNFKPVPPMKVQHPETFTIPGQPCPMDIGDMLPDLGENEEEAHETQPGSHKLAWGSMSSTGVVADTVDKSEGAKANKDTSRFFPEDMVDNSKDNAYPTAVGTESCFWASSFIPKTAKQMMLYVPRASSSRDIVNTTSLDEYQRFVHASCIRRLVCSPRFEQCILFVIGMNAIFLAVETEIAVSNYTLSQTVAVKAVDLTFWIIFAVELGLRIFVFRCSFFQAKTPYGRKNQDRAWNIFDCCIVGAKGLEMLLQELVDMNSTLGSITILRLFRILRLGQLFRVQKVMRMFRFLRIIVTSIYHSISAFFWAVVSMELITFVFAVYFTDIVALEFHAGQVDPELQEYFGSLSDSQLSLLKSVTGGIDWGDLAKPLRKLGIMSAFVPFLGYLMFMLIVTMNVFTGIFLDAASQRAQHEREIHLVKAAHQIFEASSSENSDLICKSDFKENLTHPDVQEFFETIDLDIQQADVLFSLLDTSGDGVISYDEFLRGCLRLRGTAKALDLLILSREVTQLFARVGKFVNANGEALRMNRQMLSDLHEATEAHKVSFAKVHNL